MHPDLIAQQARNLYTEEPFNTNASFYILHLYYYTVSFSENANSHEGLLAQVNDHETVE
jgi:hypothetical protein